MELLMLLRSIF